MKRLSVIIPAYNEAPSIPELLRRVLAVDTALVGFEKEIILVDDGSTDGTADIARKFEGITVLTKVNGGKGSAVQAGIRVASGDVLLIQDADMEYYPEDYLAMLQALGEDGKTAVYGSRPLGQIVRRGWFVWLPGKHPKQGTGPWLMNLGLCVETLLLFGRIITDNLTAYKLYPAAPLKRHTFVTSGFEGDHEITCLLLRHGYRIVEVPIDYAPRSVEEGKKIRMRDGVIALWTFLRCRFAGGD